MTSHRTIPPIPEIETPGPIPEPLAVDAEGRLRRRFLFIRGHPRSGTNWLGRVLNLHPRVHTRGEFHFEHLQDAFARFMSKTHYMGAKPPVRDAARKMLRQSIRQCLGAIGTEKPDAIWLGDRSPTPLRRVLPGARQIVILRDGRDVLVSFTFHQFKNGELWKQDRFKKSFTPMRDRFLADPDYFRQHPGELLADESWVRFVADRWATRALHDLEAARRLHGSKDGDRVAVLRYEDLHADVERVRSQLYRFLGLDPAEAAPVEEGEDTRPGLEKEQPGEYRRKGQVGDWRNYFSDRTEKVFMEAAGDVLEGLGYQTDTTGAVAHAAR
ncbi:MAG: sulfotransferase [Phycisphaerales bacterium JB037]